MTALYKGEKKEGRWISVVPGPAEVVVVAHEYI